MNTYVEIIGPYNLNGNFSSDGLYLNNPADNVRIELVRQQDSSKITFGPLIVSWNGRMISSQVFVNPFVSPNSEYWYNLTNEYRIPFRVFVNGTYSNVDTFYVVKPFPFGDKSGSAHWELGSGVLGVRSRRGAIIAGYTKLANASYGIAVTDCDPYSPGNQGYLPFTFISKEIIEGSGANTVINAGGSGRHAGPGGGGGGGRFCDATALAPSIIGDDGGDGFTAGGPGGRNRSALGDPNAFKNTGTSTGSAGASLNGVPSPTPQWYESSGGGTGHPFGIAGQGCGDGDNCNPPGGYGGGSGYRQNSRGGAGGFRTNGAISGTQNGGLAYGGDDGMPLAGGSGGASGNPNSGGNCSGNGGGGGGAVRVSALSLNRISVRAIGADGSSSTYSQAHGGAGSGGYVELGAKIAILNAINNVSGGNTNMGGMGLIRMESPFIFGSSSNPSGVTVSRSLTTDSTSNVFKKFSLTGSKPANIDSVRLYIKSSSTAWVLDTVLHNLRNVTDWKRDYYLPGSDSVYFIVAIADKQRYYQQANIVNQQYLMSQSSANVIFKNKNPEILADSIRKLRALACIGNSVLDSFYIYNNGDAGLHLELNSVQWKYGILSGFKLFSPVSGSWVRPKDSIKIYIKYDYLSPQSGVVIDTLYIRHNDLLAADNPIKIAYSVTLDSVEVAIMKSIGIKADTLNFGKVCVNDSADLTFYLNSRSSIRITCSENIIGNCFTQLIDLTGILNPDTNALGLIRFKPDRTGQIISKLVYTSKECAEENDTLVLKGEGISGEFAYEKPLNNIIDTLVLGSYCVGGSVSSYFLIRGMGGQLLTTTPNQRLISSEYIYEAKSVGTIQDKSWDTVHFDIWPLIEGPIEVRLGTTTFQCGGYTDSLLIKLQGVRPELTYSGKGDFGVVNNDFRDTISVIVRNTGSADLYIESLKPLNPPFRYLNILPAVPVLLKPNDFITASIEFYPRADGFFVDSLSPLMVLSDSTCQDPKTYPITGLSTNSRLVMSDTILNFGVLQYCDELQDSVTIDNPTTVNISLTNPRIQGVDASFFQEVQGFTSPRQIAPGEKAVYYMRFKPTWGPDGIKRAQFVVNSDFPKQPVMTCELIGEQENLNIDFNPDDLNFGSVPIGIQRQQTIRVINNGKIPQDLVDVILLNPDMTAAPMAGFLVAGGGFVDVDVTFKPTVAGSANSQILFLFKGLRDGKEKCLDTAKTNVFAIGQEGQVLITPRIIYELKPPCADGLDSMEITNTGASTVYIDSMKIVGPDAALFNFTANVTFPQRLDSAESLKRFVRYSASSQGYGIKTALVISYVNVGAKTKADTTFLSVEKKNLIVVSPSILNFGSIVIGQFNELDMTISNVGNSPVVISNINLPFNSTEFYFNPSPVGLIVNPGSPQTVKMRFRPTSAVFYSDSSALIESYAGNCFDSSSFKMTGTGIPPIDTRLMIDTVSGIDPRDYLLSIPIRGYITNPVVTSVGNLEFNARISFNKSLFNLHKINNASVIKDSIDGSMRYVDFLVAGLTLTNDTTIIATLNGRPLLGNADFTMINWDIFRWENPTAFGITDTIPGSIRINICSDGGPRLLNSGNPLSMMISPNPSDEEIEIGITALESGKHILELFDMSGASSELLQFDVTTNGSHDFTFKHSLTEYGSGFYYLILKSPTSRIVKPIMIMK